MCQRIAPHPVAREKAREGSEKRRARSVERPNVRMAAEPSVCDERSVADATPAARARAHLSFVVARAHESSWCVRGEARDRSRAMAWTRDRARGGAASIAARRRAEGRRAMME